MSQESRNLKHPVLERLQESSPERHFQRSPRLRMTKPPLHLANVPAIQVLHGIEGWENVPIEECSERLISLSKVGCGQITVTPAYHSAGLKGALPDAYLREGAAIRLVKATGLLPEGFQFAVWDAWRPIEVQKALFDQMLEISRLRHPLLSENELIHVAEQYAARPSENVTAPYPHSTGGAIDLTLVDDVGHLLEMGGEHDTVSPVTATRYYEDKLEQRHSLTETERKALWNRRLLFHALNSVGFRNYRSEWWHFDFGDQLWAVQEHTIARYGRVSL